MSWKIKFRNLQIKSLLARSQHFVQADDARIRSFGSSAERPNQASKSNTVAHRLSIRGQDVEAFTRIVCGRIEGCLTLCGGGERWSYNKRGGGCWRAGRLYGFNRVVDAEWRTRFGCCYGEHVHFSSGYGGHAIANLYGFF
jgi:hypothetical protein